MATNRSSLTLSDETYDFKCTSCAEDKRLSGAVKYCIECAGYFCSSCVSTHEKFLTLRRHTFLESCSASSTSGSKTQLPSFPTEKCKKHKGKIVDMYCGSHDVVGCYACIAMDHTYCNDLHSIPDDINKLFKEPKTQQAMDELRSQLRIMKRRGKRAENQLQYLKSAKTEAIKAIKAYRAELEAYLDNLEQGLIKELEDKFKKMEADLLQEKVKLDQVVNDLKEINDHSNISGENIAQRFVCGKLAQIITPPTTSHDLRGKYSSVEISFTPNTQLRDILLHDDSMGSVSEDITWTKTDAYRIVGTKSLAINLPDDRAKCVVVGSCLTEDHSLLLADRDNNRLKRYSLSGVTDYFDLSNKPNAVCLVSKTEAAVACLNQVVQLVSLEKQITSLRKIDVGHNCYGIAFIDGKLCISDRKQSLYIHDLSGTLVKKISKDGVGQQFFASIGQVAFSACDNVMFVSDDKNGLVCFDAKYEHIVTINDPDIKGANGVCVDGRGNVFVIGCHDNNVVQYSEDGQKIGVVIKQSDGLSSYPRSACFYRKSNMILIATSKSNVMKIYHLA